VTGGVIEGRLHPLAAVMYGARVARMAAPLLLAGWVADVPRLALVAAAVAIVLVGIPLGVLAWWRFRYRVEEGRLIVDAGVLVRRNRVVPLERVRGVSLDEPLVHRVFGLVRARVEAAAAGEPGGELSLAAISRPQADALRDAVMRVAEPSPDAPVVAEPPPVVSMTPGRLALAGATSARFVLVPAAAAGGMLGFADDLGLEGLLRRSAGEVADRAPSGAGGITAAVLVVTAAVVVLAALGSVIADWAFELRSGPLRIATVRGLLSRRRTTVDRRRLLGVEVHDSPLRRAIGMAAVTGPVGGFSVSGDGDAAGRVRLLPLGDRAEVVRVVAEVAPGEAPTLQGHPRAGLPRRLLRALALPVAAAAVAAVGGVWWGVVAAGAATLMMTSVAMDRHRNLGHGTGRWLVLRSGSLARRASRLDPAASVGYTVRSSPSQRRRGLCSVDVHLGLGAGSRTALDLGDDQAHALVTTLQPWARADG